MPKRVLVVDDETYMTDMIGRALVGYGYEVHTANNGQEALRVLYAQKPDLVVLDVVMPVMDGWETCSRIREMSDVPIIMLTGNKTTEEDVERGIDLGADDYLIKPVGNKELAAKIRAVLRRAEAPAPADAAEASYRDDNLMIDLADRKVVARGERVKLTPTEFRLLSLLVEAGGRVVTHEHLLSEVWGLECIDNIDYVHIYISHLRRKIEPDPRQPRYIITESRVGYYFDRKSSSG